MKQNNLGKITWLILLLLLLAALTVMPAAAQGPEGEGDVEIQTPAFTAFAWDPTPASVTVGDGSGVQRLNILDAERLYGVTLNIGYDNNNLSVDLEEVRPGSLLPGVPGVDYFFDVVPAPSPGCAPGVNDGFTVIILYSPGAPVGPIEDSGTLVEIPWHGDTIGGPFNVCLDDGSFLADRDGSFTTVGVNYVGVVNVVGGPSKFRIDLEGGKSSGLNVATIPPISTNVLVNGFIPCPVTPAGECLLTLAPPYNIEIQRPGYLSAQVSFASPSDVSSVTLLAGDLNGDDVVNIFDLTIMAGIINSPVPIPPAPDIFEKADYNGGGVVTIIDMIFVAKNFGLSGPTDGSPSLTGTTPSAPPASGT